MSLERLLQAHSLAQYTEAFRDFGIESVGDVAQLRREDLGALSIQGLPDAKRYFRMLREVANASPLPSAPSGGNRSAAGPRHANSSGGSAQLRKPKKRSLPRLPSTDRGKSPVSAAPRQDLHSPDELKRTKKRSLPKIDSAGANSSTRRGSGRGPRRRNHRPPPDSSRTSGSGDVPPGTHSHSGGVDSERGGGRNSGEGRPRTESGGDDPTSEPTFVSMLTREETVILSRAPPAGTTPVPTHDTQSRPPADEGGAEGRGSVEATAGPTLSMAPRRPSQPKRTSASPRTRRLKAVPKKEPPASAPESAETKAPLPSAKATLSPPPRREKSKRRGSKGSTQSVRAPSPPPPDVGDEEDGIEDVRIRVCVRKRPLGKRERRRNESDAIEIEAPARVTIVAPRHAVDMTQYNQRHSFLFDQVFDASSSNAEVYRRTARPLVRSAVDRGCRVACFAYGQTGAGKTHTMMGIPGELPGLYYLGAADLFARLREAGRDDTTIVMASFYEIYCGKLYDLLHRRKQLHAREDGHGTIHIRGIEKVPVYTADDIMTVIERGSRARATEATGANDTSSRSHAIIQLDLVDPATRSEVGRVSFIDLAGSERASDTMDNDKNRRMEGAEINTSLLALKECIRGLDQGADHIPFRQSKLTMVLKESFVGNSRTCMIACLAPGALSCEHTLNTVRYADRVKELSGPSTSPSPMGSRSTSDMSGVSARSKSSVASVAPGDPDAPAPKKKKRKTRKARPEWVEDFAVESPSPPPECLSASNDRLAIPAPTSAASPDPTDSVAAQTSKSPQQGSDQHVSPSPDRNRAPPVEQGDMGPPTEPPQARASQEKIRAPKEHARAPKEKSRRPPPKARPRVADQDWTVDIYTSGDPTPRDGRPIDLSASSPNYGRPDPWGRRHFVDGHSPDRVSSTGPRAGFHNTPEHFRNTPEYRGGRNAPEHWWGGRKPLPEVEQPPERPPQSQVPVDTLQPDQFLKQMQWSSEFGAGSPLPPVTVADRDVVDSPSPTESNPHGRPGRKRWDKGPSPSPRPMWTFDDHLQEFLESAQPPRRTSPRVAPSSPRVGGRTSGHSTRNPPAAVVAPSPEPRRAYPGPLPGEDYPTPSREPPRVEVDPSTGRRLTKVEIAKQEALKAFGGLSLEQAATPQPKVKSVMTMKDWTPRNRQAAT
eukprot:m.108651 g.108651  ORF g.108651 m.108651 type:complete len:1165 (+) comp12814_c0_seq1:99-3593(+)